MSNTNKIDINNLADTNSAELTENETADETIIIRISKREKANLKINAKKKRLTMSAYIKNAVYDIGGFEQTSF